MLVSCLLSERVIAPDLEKRLRKAGIDLDAVRRCVVEFCRSGQPAERLAEAAAAAFQPGGVAAVPPHELRRHGEPRPPEKNPADT